MPEISLNNSSGRDAIVSLASVGSRLKVRWIDRSGMTAESVRIVKSTIEHDMDSLIAQFRDASSISQELINGDPEIDFQSTGLKLQNSSRIFLDGDRKIAHRINQIEIVRNPDGSERERRPRQLLPPNVSPETALKWSGKLIKKDEAVRKFVFTSNVQLRHVNGLTFDFLYNMAKELEAADSLMVLGAGPKSNQPLILRRGGTPYRGFLEGRTDGNSYCLILHLSNLELKSPHQPESIDD
ncbi:MAG: hypothetical protein R3C03_01735 [Pirellulaceae bacterium]